MGLPSAARGVAGSRPGAGSSAVAVRGKRHRSGCPLGHCLVAVVSRRRQGEDNYSPRVFNNNAQSLGERSASYRSEVAAVPGLSRARPAPASAWPLPLAGTAVAQDPEVPPLFRSFILPLYRLLLLVLVCPQAISPNRRDGLVNLRLAFSKIAEELITF